MDRSDFEALDAGAVVAALEGRAGGFALEIVPECDSTSSRLLETLPPDDGRIHVLAADRQTAGRGRRGRMWQSWPGAGLTFSALWRFAPSSLVPAGLSLVVGLAVARTLEDLGVEGVQLKWPNDVLIHGKKIAGILVELNSGRGRAPAAVIGIGINLNLPTGATVDYATGVTDLASCLAAPPGPNRLLAQVLVQLQTLLDVYVVAGFGALRGAWLQRNAFADLPVRIVGEALELAGTCAGVDEDGALLLLTSAGMQRVLSGEVSLRLA